MLKTLQSTTSLHMRAQTSTEVTSCCKEPGSMFSQFRRIEWYMNICEDSQNVVAIRQRVKSMVLIRLMMSFFYPTTPVCERCEGIWQLLRNCLRKKLRNAIGSGPEVWGKLFVNWYVIQSLIAYFEPFFYSKSKMSVRSSLQLFLTILISSGLK